jgi:hypothetical protein
MAERGGKRTGSGRKPRRAGDPPPSKSATFSTRITAETRSAIEAEASEMGMTVSAMAEHLMKAALRQKRTAARNKETQAICYLLGELVEVVAPKQLRTDRFNPSWRDDAFLFESLKLAFIQTMDAIKPPGPLISPIKRDPTLAGTTLWGALDTPAKRASDAARILLHNLYAAGRDADAMLPESARAYADKKTRLTPYDMNTAWVDLKLGEAK